MSNSGAYDCLLGGSALFALLVGSGRTTAWNSSLRVAQAARLSRVLVARDCFCSRRQLAQLSRRAACSTRFAVLLRATVFGHDVHLPT